MPFSILEAIEKHEAPLRVTDLSRIFGLNRKTIYKMIERGDIPTLQLGVPDAIRVDPKSLAYVLRRKNPVLAKAHGAELVSLPNPTVANTSKARTSTISRVRTTRA